MWRVMATSAEYVLVVLRGCCAPCTRMYVSTFISTASLSVARSLMPSSRVMAAICHHSTTLRVSLSLRTIPCDERWGRTGERLAGGGRTRCGRASDGGAWVSFGFEFELWRTQHVRQDSKTYSLGQQDTFVKMSKTHSQNRLEKPALYHPITRYR